MFYLPTIFLLTICTNNVLCQQEQNSSQNSKTTVNQQENTKNTATIQPEFRPFQIVGQIVGQIVAIDSKSIAGDQFDEVRTKITIQTLSSLQTTQNSFDCVHVYRKYKNEQTVQNQFKQPAPSKDAIVLAVLRQNTDKQDDPIQFTFYRTIESVEISKRKQREKEVLDRLQGVWSFRYYEEFGSEQEVLTRQYRFVDNRLEFLYEGTSRATFQVTIDPDQKPFGHFDQTSGDGNAYRCIYILADDFLIFCGNRSGTRPSIFQSGTPKGGEFFIMLKRK